MFRSRVLYVLVALAIGLVVTSVASAETPQFTPVNYWVSPVQVSQKNGFFVDFDVYMASTTSATQSNPVALNFESCDGSPLQMRTRTRHLANGEALTPIKGGPGSVSAIRWSRTMGVKSAGNAAKLHLSFIGSQASAFCVYAWDASELGGPRAITISFGMK